MKKILVGLLVLGLIVIPAYASKGMNKKTHNSIVRVKSAFSVSETTERFESIAQKQGLKIVAKIDHAAGAKSINKELRPTQLIIFGNPAAGTPLMQCNQTVGIDLPQKALIWQDEQGQVWFGYNSSKYLMARHQLKGCGEETIQKIDNTLSLLAQKATQ